jgi:hypothetical protein
MDDAQLIDSPWERSALTFVQFGDDPPGADLQLPNNSKQQQQALTSGQLVCENNSLIPSPGRLERRVADVKYRRK